MRDKNRRRPNSIAFASAVCLLVAIPALAAAGGAAAPAPVFHLSFDNDLIPAIGPQEPGKWQGEQPPKYAVTPPFGKALLIDNSESKPSVFFDTPASARSSGTLLFWSKGLEKFNLYNTVFKGAGGLPSNFLAFWGSEGWGRIRKWEYDTAGVKLQMPNRRVFFPKFDPYEWTQLGFSWQEDKVRLFLNGALVAERNDFPLVLERFALGGNRGEAGTRRVLDNLKIWDRPLTESDVKRVYRQDLKPLNRPVVTVPFLAAAPTVDGAVGKDEWAPAAKLTGLLDADAGELVAEQSEFLLGYNDEFLFVAMVGELTALARTAPEQVYGKFLKAEHKGRSPDLAGDDIVDIILSPDYWTAAAKDTEGWTEYRLQANNGKGYRAAALGAEGENPDWQPEWERAAHVTPDGWQFEGRIPLAVFGESPAPGDEWGLQLGRVWRHLQNRCDLWAWGRYAVKPAGSAEGKGRQPPPPRHAAAGAAGSSFGVLRFARNGAPTVRVDAVGRLSDKRLDFRAMLANPADVAQAAALTVCTDTDDVLEEKTLELAPGGTATFAQAREIVDPATSRLTFSVQDQAGAVLHRTAVAFYIEQAFAVDILQYPNYEKFLVELDLSAMSGLEPVELRVDLALTAPDGEVVFRKPGQAITTYSPILECSSAEVASGAYELSVLVRKGDDTVARADREFVKTPKAVWWDNDYGYEDMQRDVVPYPWTDMDVRRMTHEGGGERAGVGEHESDVISVWGREYRFGNRLVPEQITTLDRPLLRAPMRIVLRTADDAVLDTAAAEARAAWTRTDRTRVEGVREIAGDGFVLKNRLWAEYDGLVWNELTIAPEPEIEIASMELEIPLTPEFTDVINPANYGLHGTGKLEPEGFAANPITTLWLGNGNGGIQWFCETVGWFFTEEVSKALRVELDGDAATLRVLMIDTPTRFAEPHTVEFGFIATPVRPKINRTPYFRSRSTTGGGAWYPKGLEFMPAPDPGRNFYNSGRIYVHLNPVNTGADASGTHDFRDYGYEWLQSAGFRYTDEHTVMPTQASKSYRDYFVWRHWRYQNKYGYAGLYYDGFQPLPSANPYVGAGYTGRDGVLHTEYPILEARDVVKRLYNVTLSNQYLGAREQAIGIHQSGQPNMALAGFCTYNWNAENLNSKISESQPSYIGIVDPDVYRAEYYGHNFAWPVAFLGQARILSKWMEEEGSTLYVDHIQGLDLLHDSPPSGWHVSGPWGPCVNRAIEAAKRHHFTHWTYQFTPYWEQDIVELPHADLYASWYIARPSRLFPALDSPSSQIRNRAVASYIHRFRHLPRHMRGMLFEDARKQARWLKLMADKAILVVYNNSDWEGELRLQPDWKTLGLGAAETLTAENAVHSTGFRVETVKNDEGEDVEKAVFFNRPEEFARIDNGELVFPMTKWNYRMIVIEKR